MVHWGSEILKYPAESTTWTTPDTDQHARVSRKISPEIITDYARDIIRRRRRESAINKEIHGAFKRGKRATIWGKSKENEKKSKEKPIQRWRRIAKVVRRLSSVCIALRKYAMDAGLLEHMLVSVKTRKTTDGADGDIEELTFSLEDFKVKRELRVPPHLVPLMEKPAEYRTEEEVLAISRLMKNLASFKKYTEEMQLLMARIVRYQKCERRRVVLRKGHIGYSVYYIYSGSVTVTLETDEDNAYLQGENMCLRKGACFGEIALVTDTRRSATIVCAEECEFLVIDKEDFVDNGLHTQSEEEFHFRRRFFREWPPFENVPEGVINEITSISRTEDFRHNGVIIKDSKQNDWLWFVVKGSCDVLRLVDLRISPHFNRIKSLHSYCSKPYTATRPHTRVKSAPNSLRSRPRSHATTGATTRPKTSLGLGREFDQQSPGGATESSAVITKLSRHRLSSEDHPPPRVGFMDDQDTTQVNGLKCSSHNGAMTTEHGLGDSSSIYVSVDTLRDGQCFGLEGLADNYDANNVLSYSMVSKGCTVVHISRNKLKEMLEPDALKRMEPYVKQFASDSDLCDRFLLKSEWDHFKRDLVENVVIEKQKNTTYVNSVRNCQQEEYNSKFEMNYMTSQLYVPLTSRPGASTIGSYSLSRDDVRKMRSHRLRSAVVSRRPKTASPKSTVIDTDSVLVKEAERYGRTADRVNISSSPVGKHKGWADRFQQYTSPRCRSAVPARSRVPVPPETPINGRDTTRPASSALTRPGSANHDTESRAPRRKSTGNNVVIVNTKPLSLGGPKRIASARQLWS